MSGKTNMDKPPFIAFASDARDVETLNNFAASRGFAGDSAFQGDIRTAAEYLKTNPSPVLLLVEIPSAADAPALLDALADVCDPQTKVITIGAVNEYSFYCWLMDLGIVNYLLKPLNQAMLEAAYQKSEQPASAQGREKPPGKVIAVMGARGGVGATTVALNLAGIMAELSGKNVALVDADAQEGSISLALDIEPSRGLRDVLEKPDRIDSLFIDRVMHKPSKHLSVLSAEEMLGERIPIHNDAAEALTRELRAKYDIVILDIPRYLNPFTRQCLKASEHMVLVSEMTLLSLRDALRLTDVMRETLKIKPPVLVANRVGLAAKQEILASDFEKGASAKIARAIPFAPDIFMYIGADIPAVKHKDHAAVKPLYALAQQLVPEAKQKTTAKSKSAFDFFRKR